MDFISIQFSIHAIQRMFEREISISDVKEVIRGGKIIEHYSDDVPFESYLILAVVKNRPLHVVVAFDEMKKEVIVITVYEPDLTLWEKGFDRRKQK